jgi:branched-chain amino acid transport system substrate-binding protein
MRQADSLDVELPMLLPGIRIQTSPERPFAITQMQLQRFNGSTWERFGELIRLQY